MMEYAVRTKVGPHAITHVVTVEAENAADAALEAEMKFITDTVRIVNVEMSDGDCLVDTCENDGHWCLECNCHFDLDGWCFNCS